MARDFERAGGAAEHLDRRGPLDLHPDGCGRVADVAQDRPEDQGHPSSLMIGLRCCWACGRCAPGPAVRRRSSPASLPNVAGVHRRDAAGLGRVGVLPRGRATGVSSRSPGADHAPADDHRLQLEDRRQGGDADAEPAAEAIEDVQRRRVVLLGGAVTVCPVTAPSDRPIRAMAPSGSAAAASRPIRDSALPDATASRQPCFPQPQRGPSGSTVMCPSSAPMPVGPR